jgi:hypothetical protein
MHIGYCEVTISNCLFEGGTGDDGGVIRASMLSAIHLNGNTFSSNQAMFTIYVSGSLVSIGGGIQLIKEGLRETLGSKHLQLCTPRRWCSLYTLSVLRLLGFRQYFLYNSAPRGGDHLFTTMRQTWVQTFFVQFQHTSYWHGEVIFSVLRGRYDNYWQPLVMCKYV